MRIPFSVVLLGAASALGFSSAAFAQSTNADFNYSCVKGGDERTVRIVSPGEVGKACDVRYARSTGVRTPYHANNSRAFCQQKAEELVSTLISSGFACGQVGGMLTVEARPALRPAQPSTPATTATAAPAPVAVTPATTVTPASAPAAAPVEEPAPANAAAPVSADALNSAERDTALTSQPIIEFTPEPAPASETTFETAELPTLAPVEDEDAPVLPAETLSEPTAVATQAPAALAGNDLEEVTQATSPTPTGRLVGATPSAPPVPSAATTVTNASATPDVKSTKRKGRRRPEEVVVATLKAQAAAWNEGNLPAFMETYWKDDELKFVSGTSITKGWSSTMKRYRERYGGGEGLGQLSFEKTDVELVTKDVAVVTGRFTLAHNEEPSSGVFTLVFRRDRGVWRIVHDHTVADPSSD